MVNLRYLISVLHEAITESTSNIIETCIFLTEADISFLRSNNCLKSISCTGIIGKYDVALDRTQLLSLCH